MKNSNLRRRKRQARSYGPDLFDWAREQELLTSSLVRRVARRTGISPALALVYSELNRMGVPDEQ